MGGLVAPELVSCATGQSQQGYEKTRKCGEFHPGEIGWEIGRKQSGQPGKQIVRQADRGACYLKTEALAALEAAGECREPQVQLPVPGQREPQAVRQAREAGPGGLPA